MNKLLLMITLCLSVFGAASATSQSLFPTPQPIDLSHENWTTAFKEMTIKIAKEYAFTKHKGIDFGTLYNKYAPQVEKAQLNQNTADYYRILQAYVQSLHDAHDVIYPATNAAKSIVKEYIESNLQGSFGLIITKLGNGQYIASYVDKKGSAYQQGIRVGAVIKKWNHELLEKALKKTPYTFSNQNFNEDMITYNPSTQEAIDYEKLRLLTRNTLGKTATVTFVTPNSDKLVSTTLTAKDDHFSTLDRTRLYQDSKADSISYKVLAGSIGYLKIRDENDGDWGDIDRDEKQSPYYLKLKTALYTLLRQEKVKGLVIDLRGNTGGDGRLGIDLASFFYSGNPLFFMQMSMYNTETNKYQIVPKGINLGPYYIKANDWTYNGSVIVLTDIGTVSAGEYFPYAVKLMQKAGYNNIKIMSLNESTQGAFSQPVPMITMPNGFSVFYEYTRAIDQRNRIIGDSNAHLHGGVATDIHIPMTKENAIAIYTNQTDVALQYARDWLLQDENKEIKVKK